MAMHRLMFSVVMVGSFAAFVPEAQALDADCMSKFGECSVSNVPDDSTFCDCTNGSAGGAGGSNEWGGLDQAELDAVCDEQLLLFCGPPGPIEGVPCESELGMCVVDNEPDSMSCECAGGQGGGGGGGNEWDGLSDEELEAVCFEQLESFCGDPPDPEWLCENEQGGCSISTDEDVAVFCGCAGGGGGGGPGEPEWVDLGKDELLDVCFMQIAEFCGPIDPSDSDSDSESDSDPTDTSASASGSSDESGGSGETTGGETTETTGAQESSSSEGGESSGASATMTASATDSDSDSATMTDPSASASNTAGEESSSGGDGGATGEPSGCSCDAANDQPPLGLALGLVGLVGMRIRRRWRR